jgi:hypothetical protein
MLPNLIAGYRSFPPVEPTCSEPWDVYHLWHEAIFETDLTYAEAKAWLDLSRGEKLSQRYREKFRIAKWEFGRSVINVIRCPICPPDAQPDPECVTLKAALEDALGDDEDGLAATYEDYDL